MGFPAAVCGPGRGKRQHVFLDTSCMARDVREQTSIGACGCVCVCKCMGLCILVCGYLRTCIQMYVRLCAYICHIYIYTYNYTHTYTRIHRYIGRGGEREIKRHAHVSCILQNREFGIVPGMKFKCGNVSNTRRD